MQHEQLCIIFVNSVLMCISRVSEAYKIIITKEGNKITTAKIILTFHRNTVPADITVGNFLKVKVYPYMPNPQMALHLILL